MEGPRWSPIAGEQFRGSAAPYPFEDGTVRPHVTRWSFPTRSRAPIVDAGEVPWWLPPPTVQPRHTVPCSHRSRVLGHGEEVGSGAHDFIVTKEQARERVCRAEPRFCGWRWDDLGAFCWEKNDWQGDPARHGVHASACGTGPTGSGPVSARVGDVRSRRGRTQLLATRAHTPVSKESSARGRGDV
jgi:hypothetical protein